ncbi:MAG: branched-chain amino acid ABC transporter permease [Candidatus Nezhaarchaeota archaeon]|nr:branched-chain amino acid ABC transporter permease [Candidatus Nezhaarchaeota archaeon]
MTLSLLRSFDARLLIKSKGALAGLALLVVLALAPIFIDVERSYAFFYIYNILIYVALATSWNIVSGVTGQFSLGHNAFFGIGAYVTAIAWRDGLVGYLDIRAFLLSALFSATVAAGVGYPFLGRLRGFYFALGTLGLSEVLRLIAVNGGQYTGGAVGIQLPSRCYAGFLPYYYAALILVLAAVALAAAMLKVRIGLNWRAIRDDEVAAESIGIPTLNYKILAFVLSAVVPAMCGSLWAYYIFHVQPSSAFGITWGLYPVLMGIIGGIGTLLGPVIGAIVIGSIVQLTSMYIATLHPLISGILMIIAIVFLPQGIIGKVEKVRAARRR